MRKLFLGTPLKISAASITALGEAMKKLFLVGVCVTFALISFTGMARLDAANANTEDSLRLREAVIERDIRKAMQSPLGEEYPFTINQLDEQSVGLGYITIPWNTTIPDVKPRHHIEVDYVETNDYRSI
jgi:hypothetical protein